MKSKARGAVYQQKLIPKNILILFDENEIEQPFIIEISNTNYLNLINYYSLEKVNVDDCTIGKIMKELDENCPDEIILLL